MRRTIGHAWRTHVRRITLELMERRVLRSVIYVDDTAPGPAAGRAVGR